MLVAESEARLGKYWSPNVLPKSEVAHKRYVKIDGEYREVLFSVIQDDGKRAEARELLNSRYSWRGYGSSHDLHSDIRHTTFVAELDEKVVGTMTLAVDSDYGLAIDRTFADLSSGIRQEAAGGVCELTKLAFDDGVRSKDVLAGLFHMAFIYGTALTDCTDLFIEVNPRHVRFYELMLGFQGVGSERTNASVGAPSRLMRLGVETIRRNIRELGGAKIHASARSLYPCFFPPEEERQIRRMLGQASPSAIERIERLVDAAEGKRADTQCEERAGTGGYFSGEQMRPAA